MSRRRYALWCVLLLGMAARAEAGWHSRINMGPTSGVDIELASPFDHAPPEGFMPCWVTIKNHSGTAHTWTVRATSHATFSTQGNEGTSSQTLRVENDTTARLPILLPLETSSRGPAAYRSGTIRVEGYGVEDNGVGLPPAGYSGKTPTAVIGMGAALAVPLWEPLKKSYDDDGHALTGSPVEAGLLGSDWRALCGLDCLWLTEAEYAGLEAAPQKAIRDWVDQGGIFYLCTQSLDPALRAGLGLTDTGNEAFPGFGYVKLIPWDGKTFTPSDATAVIDGIRLPYKDGSAGIATSWAMTRSLGKIPLNAWFLIGFILVFAVLVGPVNLFGLANSARRHRLFWTTPLISLAASVLLILVIVLQDGFGGHGERTMVTLLCPDRKQAVVVQEQVTQTGVLPSRQFTVAEDLILSPLEVGRFSGKSFDQSGRNYGGDWFASRSTQAQRAEAIVPSRAEIQLLNADAANAGAPPVVVSSVPAALKDVHYLDPAGRAWQGGALRTGEQITLQPDPTPARYSFGDGSVFLSNLQQETWKRRGYFYAIADDGPFIDTLRSIRWQKQQAVYLGPVTVATR